MSQTTSIQNNGIIIYVYSDPSTQGKGVIQVVADHPVASTLAISLDIQYGVSSGDRRTYNLTLAKGQYLLNQKFDIQIGAYPQVLSYILNYNGQYVTSGTLPASQDEYLLIPVTKVPWSDNGSYTEPTAIFELYLKGSQLVPYSDFYFNMSLYDAQDLFYGCNREYSQAINYKIDTVDPSDWTPSGSYSHGSITVKKGNLSPSDFSGGILIELILGNKINGYVKRVMLRIKVN